MLSVLWSSSLLVFALFLHSCAVNGVKPGPIAPASNGSLSVNKPLLSPLDAPSELPPIQLLLRGGAIQLEAPTFYQHRVRFRSAYSSVRLLTKGIAPVQVPDPVWLGGSPVVLPGLLGTFSWVVFTTMGPMGVPVLEDPRGVLIEFPDDQIEPELDFSQDETEGEDFQLRVVTRNLEFRKSTEAEDVQKRRTNPLAGLRELYFETADEEAVLGNACSSSSEDGSGSEASCSRPRGRGPSRPAPSHTVLVLQELGGHMDTVRAEFPALHFRVVLLEAWIPGQHASAGVQNPEDAGGCKAVAVVFRRGSFRLVDAPIKAPELQQAGALFVNGGGLVVLQPMIVGDRADEEEPAAEPFVLAALHLKGGGKWEPILSSGGGALEDGTLALAKVGLQISAALHTARGLAVLKRRFCTGQVGGSAVEVSEECGSNLEDEYESRSRPLRILIAGDMNVEMMTQRERQRPNGELAREKNHPQVVHCSMVQAFLEAGQDQIHVRRGTESAGDIDEKRKEELLKAWASSRTIAGLLSWDLDKTATAVVRLEKAVQLYASEAFGPNSWYQLTDACRNFAQDLQAVHKAFASHGDKFTASWSHLFDIKPYIPAAIVLSRIFLNPNVRRDRSFNRPLVTLSGGNALNVLMLASARWYVNAVDRQAQKSKRFSWLVQPTYPPAFFDHIWTVVEQPPARRSSDSIYGGGTRLSTPFKDGYPAPFHELLSYVVPPPATWKTTPQPHPSPPKMGRTEFRQVIARWRNTIKQAEAGEGIQWWSDSAPAAGGAVGNPKLYLRGDDMNILYGSDHAPVATTVGIRGLGPRSAEEQEEVSDEPGYLGPE